MDLSQGARRKQDSGEPLKALSPEGESKLKITNSGRFHLKEGITPSAKALMPEARSPGSATAKFSMKWVTPTSR